MSGLYLGMKDIRQFVISKGHVGPDGQPGGGRGVQGM